MSKYKSSIDYSLPQLYNKIFENSDYDDLTIHGLESGSKLKYNLGLKKMRTAIKDQLLEPASVEQAEPTIYSDDAEYKIISKWFPSDSQELFKSNTEDKLTKSLLNKLGWCDKSGNSVNIEYKLNKQGFRAKNLDLVDKSSILFLGCSQTFGVGMNIETTFSQIISDYFDMENLNYGQPGHGLEPSALYLSLFLDKEIDPSLIKAVVVYLPPPGRPLSFFYDRTQLNIRNMADDGEVRSEKFIREPLQELNFGKLSKANEYFGIEHGMSANQIDDRLQAGYKSIVDEHRSTSMIQHCLLKENMFMRDVFAINSIDLFCKTYNIPLIIQKQNEINAPVEDVARDLSHHGKQTHQAIAYEIINKLKIYLDK
jgi:hypothetical protein